MKGPTALLDFNTGSKFWERIEMELMEASSYFYGDEASIRFCDESSWLMDEVA